MKIFLCDKCGKHSEPIRLSYAKPGEWIEIELTYSQEYRTKHSFTLCEDCTEKLRLPREKPLPQSEVLGRMLLDVIYGIVGETHGNFD